MVSHIVLFRVRSNLTGDERQALVDALRIAIRDVPSVRGCRIGQRVTFGAGYEHGAADLGFAVVIDFEDLEGLRAYLAHPAHADLGSRFTAAVEQALIYDYAITGLEGASFLEAAGAREGNA